MAEMEPKRKQDRPVGRNATERLLSVIEYPERIPMSEGSVTLRVDGREVLVAESDGRIVLSVGLTDDDSMVPALAAYATGRMLREDATLAYGRRSVDGSRDSNSRLSAFLWQDASTGASDRDLLRLFETFMDSCDWWQSRVDSPVGGGDEALPESMVIRP